MILLEITTRETSTLLSHFSSGDTPPSCSLYPPIFGGYWPSPPLTPRPSQHCLLLCVNAYTMTKGDIIYIRINLFYISQF